MRLGILRSEPCRLARLAQGGLQVSFSNERIAEIHVRLREFGFQLHRGPKLRDGGIDFSLSKQNPAQRVVSFWTLRRKANNFFKIRARGNQIALLQRGHASLVSCSRPRSRIRLGGVCLGRICGLRSARCRGSGKKKKQRRRKCTQMPSTMQES